MKKAKTVFLVIYSHRFGDDFFVCTTKKKANECVKEIENGPDFEPDRDDESVHWEEVEVR